MGEQVTYQTIQVVPLSVILPELNKLYEKISSLEAEISRRKDETVLSDAEAALRLGVSVSTLRRMKQDGRVNSLRTAHGLVCRVCDCDEYAANKK